MKNIAILFPSLAWISVSFDGWAGGVVVVRCGLVDDGRAVRLPASSLKDGEKRFREKYNLSGVRLRRRSI